MYSPGNQKNQIISPIRADVDNDNDDKLRRLEDH